MADAVVFDLDGTLVDSEPIAERSWAAVLANYDYVPSAGDVAATRGLSSSDTALYLARAANIDPDIDLVAAVDAVRVDLLDAELEAFRDAVEAVRELAGRGVPLAVATSSSRRLLDTELRLTDLGRYFTVTVSVDDVRLGKPAPDIYLEAASRLNVDPALCLAVEDTDLGADAAVAAGMRVIQIRRDGSLSMRHAVVSTLDAAIVQTAMWR